MSADGLPPLREVIEQHGIAARKALGQNFLFDLNLTGKIARSAGELSTHTIIEIGPGPGGLTRALLNSGAKKVIAIERDQRCISALEEIATVYPGRLEIIHGDALQTNLETVTEGLGNCRIVSNLPYNIGTELLVRWVTIPRWPPFYSSMTLMFQREVAERIIAKPGTKHYGRLGVLVGWRCKARRLFDVPREAFIPPPKVTSSVVHLEPRDTPVAAELSDIEAMTKAAFGQRRKMLRQSLKPLGGETLLNRAGIDPKRRAETLTVEEFAALANAR